MEPDAQLRNLKDFLLVYNRMTEICFQRCSSNFNYRNLTMDEERCVDNCAGKLIRSNHRLMGTYVQLMPRMVQRRMEELESKAAENAKLEAEAAAAASVGPESTPVALSPTVPIITNNDATQNPLELNTNEVGPLGATQLTPATENILDNGTSATVVFTGVQSPESVPYESPKAAFLPEDATVIATSAPQKSTEDRAGPASEN